MNIAALVPVLDYGSVIIFAVTGALVASRAQLDLVGFIFMAALTAVGGGTLRDLILDRDMVFWVAQPAYVLIAAGCAVAVFWTAHLVESRYKLLIWLDSVALAIAAAAGVGVALAGGFGPVVVVIMGVVTSTFGGLMRDVVGNELPLVLKQGELYLTAAFGGALAMVGLIELGIAQANAVLIGAVIVWILRAGSLVWCWKLPVYKSRPPKTMSK